MNKSPFEFHPRRAAGLGALGFGIGLPLSAIARLGIPDQFLRWGAAAALLGGLTGILLSLASPSRRPLLGLAFSGIVGGVIGYCISSFLYASLNPWMGSNPQLGMTIMIDFVNDFPFFLCVGIGWGFVIGGTRVSLKFAGYTSLGFCAGFIVRELTGAFLWSFMGVILEYLIVGAVLGWAMSRERPVTSTPPPQKKPLRKFALSRKRITGCAVLVIVIPLFICGGILLPRFLHASYEVHAAAQSSLPDLPRVFPKIDRHPAPFCPEAGSRGKMSALPHYGPDSMDPFQMYLGCYDLSSLDLRNSLPDLMLSTFDAQTIWPAADKMPDGFDPERIMELGKDPGLGIHNLHSLGITGRGVGIAIIDSPLIVDHQEYAGQLRLYEEVGFPSNAVADMHGPAVASIAVGKTVGVAPDADLYFIADSMCNQGTYESVDFACLAKSVRRILEINRSLPVDRKIRVLSMSIGWGPQSKGFQEIMDAVREANNAGVFVASTSIDMTNGFHLFSLGREPYADPDSFSSYGLGLFISKDPARRLFSELYILQNTMLWVTMDSRTTASPTGAGDYVFYREGGMSWSVPYVAGIYALAAQVDPSITPEAFWSLALKTGRTVFNDQTLILGPIIDPPALIAALQS